MKKLAASISCLLRQHLLLELSSHALRKLKIADAERPHVGVSADSPR